MTYHLTGGFTLNLLPAKAFRLFTPMGERDWAAGWRPEFPVPTDDDTAPGTVFQIATHNTTWVVVEADRPRRITYAQLRPGERAGTVTITLDEVAGASSVTVTYRLTPLTEAAKPELDHFAAGYPAFLASWHQAITTRMPGVV